MDLVKRHRGVLPHHARVCMSTCAGPAAQRSVRSTLSGRDSVICTTLSGTSTAAVRSVRCTDEGVSSVPTRAYRRVQTSPGGPIALLRGQQVGGTYLKRPEPIRPRRREVLSALPSTAQGHFHLHGSLLRVLRPYRASMRTGRYVCQLQLPLDGLQTFQHHMSILGRQQPLQRVGRGNRPRSSSTSRRESLLRVQAELLCIPVTSPLKCTDTLSPTPANFGNVNVNAAVPETTAVGSCQAVAREAVGGPLPSTWPALFQRCSVDPRPSAASSRGRG